MNNKSIIIIYFIRFGLDETRPMEDIVFETQIEDLPQDLLTEAFQEIGLYLKILFFFVFFFFFFFLFVCLFVCLFFLIDCFSFTAELCRQYKEKEEKEKEEKEKEEKEKEKEEKKEEEGEKNSEENGEKKGKGIEEWRGVEVNVAKLLQKTEEMRLIMKVLTDFMKVFGFFFLILFLLSSIII